MKENKCDVVYKCFAVNYLSCTYHKQSSNKNKRCIYHNPHNETYACTSSLANTNRLVLELERITGIKIKEVINS